ncbi:MAG TPA: ABC transporter substrate-binding protein [Streptosporangiaceae bacterium]|nr:ABC transporter substrate-binding protein [Streptosporangiaceae bacterium]
MAIRHSVTSGLRRRIFAATACAGALALLAAGCGSSSGTSATSGGKPVTGGTAVWAEPPSTTPNYIFPFTSSSYISIININDFSQLMYRPLYWFGNGDQPTVNPSLSLADPPVISGKKVTINLKNYKWSDGTPVTAQDVMFWLNMELALPQDYGAYTGFPANVKDMRAVSPTQLTMTMNKAYSPTWFLYNDLSQVTPMPAAWDRTASGPSHCATTVKDCAAVYKYLDEQSKKLSSYATSPLWSDVDGPWKLSAFNADGHVTFVPNKSYSGPVKPHLAQFQEVPFTTDSAEYDVLQSPNSSSKIDVGYLPTQDAPAKPAGVAVGKNPLSSKDYSLSPLYLWGINYYATNFQSTTGNGPVINQLYFRQALAYLMNQAGVISGPLRGYGTETVGPVGNNPATKFLSPQLKGGTPYPYSPAKAKALLASHGWKVTPNGITTCTNPSLCGPGIKKGHQLAFNFPFASGVQWLTSEMQQLQSSAATVGIKINLQPKPFDQVTALAAGNCVVAKIPCNWDLADWGGGWSFDPDFLPTGETLFQSGAIANSGGFKDPANDQMISKTLTSSSPQALYQWENYLAKQLPMQWQPSGVYEMTEVAGNLRGVTPQSPTLTINPENWYFVK